MDLTVRWALDLHQINKLVKKRAEMLLPIQLVCSAAMRRIRLVRLKPTGYS